MAEIFEKVSFDPYNFRITKIRLTMLCLSGFELYSRSVPLVLIVSRVNGLITFDEEGECIQMQK